MGKITGLTVNAGFKTKTLDSAQHAYGVKVRDNLCAAVGKLDTFAGAEAAFDQACTAIDGGLRELWLQVEGRDARGKFVARSYCAEL